MPYLEHDGHDVIAHVPLPLQLLAVRLGEGEQRGDVKHDLPVLEHLVQTLLARLAVRRVEAAPIPLVLRQRDPPPQHPHEVVHGRRVRPVAEELLLRDLARPLVDEAELEAVVDDVLVVGHDELRGARAQHRREPIQRQLRLDDLRHAQRRHARRLGDQFVDGSRVQSQDHPRVVLSPALLWTSL